MLRADSASSWTPPAFFEEYRILRPLGRGGMGVVYLAHDTLLDRHVAAKFILALDPGVAPDAQAREQFLVEARAAARVQHPNVLTIYGVGELDGRPFIISEFVRGRSLDELPTPMASADALRIGVALSRGLAAAHRRGVLHRDIKPSNAIVVDDGSVKLIDFGIAKIFDRMTSEDESLNVGEAELSRSLHLAATIPIVEAEPRPGSPRSSLPATISASNSTAPTEAGAEPTGTKLSRPSTFEAAPTIAAPPQPGARDSAAAMKSSTVIRGTPYYMAPEIWRGESATRRSDVYSLGALLFELCVGEPPHRHTPMHELPHVVMSRDAAPLASAAPTVRPEFAAIIQRCLSRDPAHRYSSGEELSEALERLLLAPVVSSAPEGNPYRGLLSFEAEHRSLFFGRTNEIGILIERLRHEPVVVVAGDSGVGKSSLCRAGVLPYVVDGALGDGRVWTKIQIVPGIHPLATLAAALSGVLSADANALEALMSSESARIARDLSRAVGDSKGLILFLDQAEELVTTSEPTEAAIAGEMLAHLAARAPGLRLLMTVRSDFLARLSAVSGIGDELTEALYLLRPLSPSNMKEAIVGPARARRVSFESEELVKTLVESTVHTEGGLPLLQFALAELWQARSADSATITAESLYAIGGVAGALARHADDVLLRLAPSERDAARRVLVALVTTAGTRARRTERELLAESPNASAALKALVGGRLLVHRDTTSGIAYELAHEALLKGWDALRGWIEEQADYRILRQRLEAAAAEWERLRRTPEALWSARQLREVIELDVSKMEEREATFLAASRRAVWRKQILAALAILGTLATVLIALYMATRRERARQVDTAMARALVSIRDARSKGEALEAHRKDALTAYDAGRVRDGDVSWDRATKLAAQVDRAYGLAGQELEAGLSADPTRKDARSLLGDVLYEQARVATRFGSEAQLDELMKRLARNDEDAARRRRLSPPIMIETEPAGAEVTLARYVTDDSGRRQLTAARAIGSTPTTFSEIVESGSYLLSFTAPERVRVLYPIVLGREDQGAIKVEMPFAADVPSGFLYIPSGRFLFGSIQSAPMRKLLATTPAREVSTDAYLIARYETTFAEWIDYLNALPPDERGPRWPPKNPIDVWTSGFVELEAINNGEWRLSLRASYNGNILRARPGEDIVYAGRKTRASQNWLRFPVVGVVPSDVLGYARWLDASGRVRGARLCTEREWERAARGADARNYPSGDSLEPGDANFDETYGQAPDALGPDEVGSHPASRSPFGLDDMAGNVFEWTLSPIEPNTYVVRGGSFWYGEITASSTKHSLVDSTFRDVNVGFRICASPQKH